MVGYGLAIPSSYPHIMSHVFPLILQSTINRYAISENVRPMAGKLLHF